MKKKGVLLAIMFLFLFLFINIVFASTTVTDDLINTSGNVTATYFSGDGSLLTDINNSNSTTWWSSLSSWLSGWFVNNAGTLEFNETKLNITIDARDSDTSYNFQCSTGQFVKNLTNSGSYVCDTPAGGSGYISLYASGNFNGSLYTTGTDPTASDSNSIFQIIGSNGAPQFQIQNGGDGQASFIARSFLVVNENATRLNQSQNNLCSDWGFTHIDCNSSETGADMGVQDDLEVEGLIYADHGIYSDTSTWGDYLFLGNLSKYADGGVDGEFNDSEDRFCDYGSNPFTQEQVDDETWIEITEGVYKGASAGMTTFINSSCVMVSYNPSWDLDISNQKFDILPEPTFVVSDGGFVGIHIGSDSHSMLGIKIENGTDFVGVHIDDTAGADQHKSLIIDTDANNHTGILGINNFFRSTTGGNLLDLVGYYGEFSPTGIDNSDFSFMEFHQLGPRGANNIRVFDIFGNFSEIMRHEEVEEIDYVGYWDGTNLINITANATSAATDMEIFSNDNDEVYFCDTVNLTEISVNLQIESSFNLNLNYYYYASDGDWKPLSVTDTTNGFTITGSVRWATPADINKTLTDRNTKNIGASYYCIVAQRTRNNLVTPPTEDFFVATGNIQFLLRDDLIKLTPASLPPLTCDASIDGAIYYDSDISIHCSCNGTDWVRMSDYTTTAGCS